MNDTGYNRLAEAIILQAVTDYRRASWKLCKCCYHEEALKTKAECERFFRSDWFSTLCNLDGRQLLLDLKRDMGLREGAI